MLPGSREIVERLVPLFSLAPAIMPERHAGPLVALREEADHHVGAGEWLTIQRDATTMMLREITS